MWRIPFGTDDTALLLAPSWSGWGPAAQAIALGLALVLPVVLCVWLSRAELRTVSRAVAGMLLALRLAALFVLWTLAALQPTVVHIEREETPSRVLVAVDLSRSMDTKDPQRTWSEKLPLACVLGLDGADTSRLGPWLEAVERGSLPSNSDLAALGDRVDALSRKDVARRLLSGEATPWLSRLQKQHHVELVGFHEALVEASTTDLDALLNAENAGTSLGTNLSPPLQRGLEERGRDKGKLLAIVVLTDGQHNQGPAPLALAKQLGQYETSIYPIALGSKNPPIDLAVLDVQAPLQVFKSAEASVSGQVRVRGLPAQSITVKLHGAGLEKQEKTIQHNGKDRTYPVEFSVKLEHIGTKRLEIRATPTKDAQREITTENNRLATTVRVAPDKARVLIVEDEPRWEFHYLSSALTRDKDLFVEQVLFLPPRIGSAPEEKLEKLGHAKRQWPASADGKDDPLMDFDCIVVGDLPPERVPRPVGERLEKFVAERGGTLVVIAGKRSMPLDYTNKNDPLVKMLPIEAPRPLQPKDGFVLSVTELGEKTPFLQLEATAEASRQRWAEMPKHFWGVTGSPKPGAILLAQAQLAQVKGAEQGLIVQQHYGFGRVVLVGLESTWRWRYRVGDRDHHRFWGQMMRWAASDPFLPEGNRFVRFGTKAPIYRHDQEVEVLVRLGEEAPPIFTKTARAKLVRQGEGKDESATTMELRPHETRPKHWEGKVKGLLPGTYRLELDVPELAEKVADLKKNAESLHTFTVTPPEDTELVDLATNWELLQVLAEQSGGRVFTPAEVDALPDLLARKVVRRESRTEHRPWRDAPWPAWILSIVLTLVTLEWSLRKWAGLP